MTGRDRALPITVLALAVIALIGSVLWFFGGGRYQHAGFRGPPAGMTGPTVPGQGPVRDLDDAERAAQRFGDEWGLRVGEVMRFSNGYYAELVDSTGAGATEVLVDQGSGAVQLEWGPAMVWNTAYGMHAVGRQDTPPVGSGDAARRRADDWLRANQPGLHAGEAEQFPGYYTLHTLRGDRIDGMLSVNSRTGAVWDHTWHGEFVQAKDYTD